MTDSHMGTFYSMYTSTDAMLPIKADKSIVSVIDYCNVPSVPGMGCRRIIMNVIMTA